MLVGAGLALAAGAAWCALTGTVSCTGTGTRPGALVVSPASLAFGQVDSGGSVVREITLRNSGGGTLTGTVRRAAGCSPWYSLVVGDTRVAAVTYSLPAGATTTVQVEFAPAGIGPATCAIEAGP